MKKIITILFLFPALLFFSCSDSSNNPAAGGRGRLINAFDALSVDTADIRQKLQSFNILPEGTIDLADLYDSIRSKRTDIFPVMTQVVHYSSVDVNNIETTLSGIVIFPVNSNQKKANNIPVVCLSHATQIMRNLAPSNYTTSNNYIQDFPEIAMAIAMASTGFIVCMPDYQGMGMDTKEFHPFCNSDLLGKASADILKATRDFFANNANVSISSDNFLIGYSEGGLVTLATAKEIEKTYPLLTLTGVIPIEGPYDLTGSMRNVIISDNPFPSPYFVSYLIRGYYEVYGKAFAWDSAMIKPYSTTFSYIVDGYNDDATLNSVMPKSKIIKEALRQEFVDKLNDPTSDVFAALNDNVLWNNWQPKCSIVFIHGLRDNCVPVGNMTKAYQEFHFKMGLNNIIKIETDISLPLDDNYHYQVAPQCVLIGYETILGLQ